MDVKSFTDKLEKYQFDYGAHSRFTGAKLSLSPGELGVLSNSRFIGPLAETEEFTADDFALLERFTASGDIVVKVSKIVKKMKLPAPKYAVCLFVRNCVLCCVMVKVCETVHYTILMLC